MILVCGSAGDGVTRFFCKRLQIMGAQNRLFDLSRYATAHRITQCRSDRGSGSISWPGDSIRTSELTGAFVRDLSRWSDQKDSASDPALAVALHAEKSLGLESFLAELDCVVVNRVASNWSNHSKPYQTLVIRDGIFEIPRTLITNNAQDARRFYEETGGQIIHKSSSGHSFGTRLVGLDDLCSLLSTRDTPVQLQERVAGTDIRVHVVREQIFATRIRSQAIDYRRAEHDEIRLEAIELPMSIAAECVRITAQFGLLFSGVDLRETVDGRYYCFEVNPVPDFAFYEERTGQQISVA